MLEYLFILVSIALFVRSILKKYSYNIKILLITLGIIITMTFVPKYNIEFNDGQAVKHMRAGFPVKYIERYILQDEEQYDLEKMRLDTLNLDKINIYLGILLINIIGAYLILYEACIVIKKWQYRKKV